MKQQTLLDWDDSSPSHAKPDVYSGPLELLILQSTSFCNLACDYCYLPGRDQHNELSLERLAILVDRLFSSSLLGEHLTLVWHAGEPLVLGVDYYEQAFSIIEARKPPGLHLHHDFQTNGTLLNQQWCDLICRYGIRIGLSIDGPGYLHNAKRKKRNGQGSLDQALRGLGLLQDNQIDFHVLTVLTRQSLNHADELYDFYINHNIRRVGFNIEELEGVHTTSSLMGRDAEQAFRIFIERFLERVVSEHPPRLSVREFDSFFQALLSREELPMLNQQIIPGAIITVDCEGNVSTYSPELLGMVNPRYNNFIVDRIDTKCVLENVQTNLFDQLVPRASTSRLGKEIASGVAQCRASCDYFKLCGGGAPANKLFENGRFDTTETTFCRFNRQILADCLLDFIERRLSYRTTANTGLSRINIQGGTV